MILINGITIFLTFYATLKKGFAQSDAICKEGFASLQICNHLNIQVEAMDIKQNLIEIRPTITFFNLARFDPHDKTVTLFIALDTAWNDTSVSVIRKG